MTTCSETIRRSDTPSLLDRMLDVLWHRGEGSRDLERLSDRQRSDIGVGRRDIATIVSREIGRLRLDEFRSRL